jgi:hypothetical protein
MRQIKHFLQLLGLVTVSLRLAGCATLSYQEPAAGSRARVRFVTGPSGITLLRTYDDVNCGGNEVEWMRLRDGFLLNSAPKRLGMPLFSYHQNAAKEVYVRSGKPVYGLFIGSETQYNFSTPRTYILPTPSTYICAVPFSHTFLENSDYEVLFEWSRFDCRVRIFEIVQDETGDHMLKEAADFDNKITEGNRGCVARLKKL